MLCPAVLLTPEVHESEDFLAKEQTVAKLDIREYARRGAQARATELREELANIYRAFPELHRSEQAVDDERSRRTRRGRKPMGAAQRKAVSQRMRKYWSAKRKAKSKAAA
jgi:hypothetical protein